MNDSHLLSTCRIDIGYNNEEKARALQSKVSLMFHSTLRRIILEALDKLDTNDEVLSIDVLEVDLGEIEEDVLDREFARRLKEKLAEALAEYSVVAQSDTTSLSATARTQTAQERYSDALEKFLLSGYMPWQYRNITTAYDTFIDKILSDYPAALIVLIRRNISNKIFLERLVKQFGPANVERVIQILAPDEAAVVVETVRKIQWLQAKEKILSIPRESFENSVWELALLYIVRDRGTHFNNKDFIRSLIKGLAARYNVDFILYLHQLHRAVQYLALYHTFKYSFPNLLEELYSESFVNAGTAYAKPVEEQENELALYFYLEHGYLTGTYARISRSDLVSVFERDKAPGPIQRITVFLQKHIAHDEIRFRTISLIKEEGSKKVVAYAEPANSQFIFDFADALQREQEEGLLGINADAKTFSLIKWDFIIYTLLNNRGSVFNTKVFILATIQIMANRYAHDFDDLLGLILKSVPTGASINHGGNLVPALKLIKDEYDKAGRRDTAPYNAQSKVQTLIRLLAGKTKLAAREKKELLALVTEIYSRSNQYLVSLLEKAILDGTISIDQVLGDSALAKQVSAVSPAVKRALELHATGQRKTTSDTAQLVKSIHAGIDRLLTAHGGQHRNISGEIYKLLARLFLLQPVVISNELRLLLSSQEFRRHVVFTETEKDALHAIAPGWFAAAHHVEKKLRKDAGAGRETFLGILQHYVIHEALPWWASEKGGGKHVINNVVLALLKHRSSQTKDQLVLLMMDRKKRKVLLNTLAGTTMSLLVKQLGNIQDTTLVYYLDLVNKVKKEKHLTTADNASLSSDQWDIVLEALLQDRGSRFNLKAFLGNTLRKLAAHFNIAYGDMLDMVSYLVGKSAGQEKKTFKGVLSELIVEFKNEGGDEKGEGAAPSAATDSNETAEHALAPFWQRLLQNLKRLNDTGAGVDILRETKGLFQQMDHERRAELLHTLTLLRWSAHEWARCWLLLEDALLFRIFEILTADVSFVGSYLTDWERISHQLFPQGRSAATRRFYELTLTYVILNDAVEKHRWFAFILSGFESLFDLKNDFAEQLTRYFKTENNITNSTIKLSFKKWKQSLSGHDGYSVSEEKPAVNVADKPKQQKATPDVTTEEPDAEDEGQQAPDYWILNCGLTLIWPFMEKYFALLDLLEQRQFKSPEAAYRGVHLLQYLASGKEGYPEYQLVLNKMLCGVKTAKPVVKDLVLTDKEKALSEDLLKGVIQNWSILGSTSVEGLRTTFLMREGLLKKGTDSDQLHVERKAFDVLIDRIPWGYTTVKLPWMERAIHVVWR